VPNLEWTALFEKALVWCT